jgi:FR47-like protein
MEPPDLINLQIGLEYQLDACGCLVPFLGSSEQAWYIIYRYAGGDITYFNHLVPAKVRHELLALGVAEAFDHPARVRKLISQLYQPCEGGGDVFWSGYFNRLPCADEFPDVVTDGGAWMVNVDGEVASRAISIRQDDQSAEAYVETGPRFRQRGLGRQVVAAWAHQVMKSGHVAFYSYRLGNTPSAALAESLGVKWYAAAVSFEPS